MAEDAIEPEPTPNKPQLSRVGSLRSSSRWRCSVHSLPDECGKRPQPEASEMEDVQRLTFVRGVTKSMARNEVKPKPKLCRQSHTGAEAAFF